MVTVLSFKIAFFLKGSVHFITNRILICIFKFKFITLLLNYLHILQ